MLPVAELALVPPSFAVSVTKLPLALLMAEELSASVVASGPAGAIGVVDLFPPPLQPMRADVPAATSSTTIHVIRWVIRLRRPANPIRKIEARAAELAATTLAVAGALCDAPPEAGARADTVIVDCRAAAPTAPVAGEKRHVTPAGRFPQAKVTFPVNPSWAVAAKVSAADEPAARVIAG